MIELRDFQILSPTGIPLGPEINFSFEKSRLHLIRGPNGAGKTSLLRALLPRLPQDTIFVSQHPKIQDFPALRVSELPDVLKPLTGLSAAAIRPLYDPDGRDREWSGRALGELSGGQLQRVLLAMALRSSAPALLLDEPENHLDESSRTSLKALFRAFTKDLGRSLIWVTHLEDPLSWEDVKCLTLAGSEGSNA